MSSMGDLQAKLAALKARQAAEQGAKADGTQVVGSSEVSKPAIVPGGTTDKTPGSKDDVVASQLVPGSKAAPTANAGIQPVPLGNAEQIVSRIAELRSSLDSQLPGYERLLQVIHTAIAKDPDIAHVLTEEQVGTIVEGLSRKKSIVLVEASKKSKSESKRLKSLTVDDL